MTRIHVIDNDQLRRVAPAKPSGQGAAARTPGVARDRTGAAPARRGASGSLGLLAWTAAISASAGADVASGRAPSGARSDDGPIRRLAALWLIWRERRAERRYLQRLNDHLLDDIGLMRRDIERGGRSGRFGA